MKSSSWAFSLLFNITSDPPCSIHVHCLVILVDIIYASKQCACTVHCRKLQMIRIKLPYLVMIISCGSWFYRRGIYACIVGLHGMFLSKKRPIIVFLKVFWSQNGTATSLHYIGYVRSHQILYCDKGDRMLISINSIASLTFNDCSRHICNTWNISMRNSLFCPSIKNLAWAALECAHCGGSSIAMLMHL